jgi:hypothetical protein
MAIFTLEANRGQEKSAITVSSGGSTTADITIIVDADAFEQPGPCARKLRDRANRLEELDWPPA